MIDLAPIVARLAADPELPEPKGAAALARIEAAPPAFLPALFVVADGETASAPRRLVGIHDQLVEASFLVLAMVRADGAPALVEAALARLTGRVEAALAGWVHPEAEGEATAILSSQLVRLDAGVIAWGQRFATRRRVRVAVTA